jgi:hypothetical protein
LSNIGFSVSSSLVRIRSGDEIVVMFERDWWLVGNAVAAMAKKDSIVAQVEEHISISSIAWRNQEFSKQIPCLNLYYAEKVKEQYDSQIGVDGREDEHLL